MKKRMLPVLVALVLIIIIGAVGLGGYFFERYSYGHEMADWNEHYQVSGEQAAIILQDEMVEEKAMIRNGICYLDLATVQTYLNEIFYADTGEQLLLYALPTEVIRVSFGSTAYDSTAGSQDLGYVICYMENDTLYVAAEYVKQFTNFSIDIYDRHIQLYTQWGSKETAEIKRNTDVREKGGVKSPILRAIAKGETVEVLEVMETWTKVKTSDSVIGYVENKRLENHATVEETPVTDYTEPEYTSISMDGKVSLGWHSIGGVAGNSTLSSMVAGTKGMNVISPTWFSMNDNEGGIRSFGTGAYVEEAHGLGLQVWGAVDNFNYANETGVPIDTYSVLASTTKRGLLIQNIMAMAESLGLDGINVDFEQLTADTGIHYVQFLRELSIACRSRALVLSVDNPVPFHFNEFYRMDIQGKIADYVIIMGYDEHWHGSGDPGSVASIEYVSGGLTKTLEQVPAHKVVNALPLYTILWKTEGGTVTDEYLTILNTADFLSGVPAESVWDETTCQNYIEWTDATAQYQMWIEDAESIRVKLNVMTANNIGGVAVWRLGYGTPAIWELISAYSGS